MLVSSHPRHISTESRKEAANTFTRVRKVSEDICRPLEIEDFVVQTMEDVSPPKWNLGHTTWFFEVMVLQKFAQDYQPFNAQYGYLFNSYYNALGARSERPQRGILSRPTVKEVYAYRHAISEQIQNFIEKCSPATFIKALPILELGVHHEQQHSELLLMDIKHILWMNPSRPHYIHLSSPSKTLKARPISFHGFDGGNYNIGWGGDSFAYDNEKPRHRIYANDYELADRCVTNGEYREFIEDGGYSNYRHWLSDGWTHVQNHKWQAPLYWENRDGAWHVMTLAGISQLNPSEPACHLSYYEANAYAKWRGMRLPTEAELEIAAAALNPKMGNFLESNRYHPIPSRESWDDLFGNVWEWSQSAYLPYPGFKRFAGVAEEYNGKFMSNQMVVKGGACITPKDHFRTTYRNFFQPEKRWQFAGVRLAK